MTDNDYNNIDKRFDLITTLLNAQFSNVHERLDKINGKVAKHDQDVIDSKLDRQALHAEIEAGKSTHIINCPIAPRVSALEKIGGIQLGIKQFVIGSITLLAVLITMSFSVLKINESIQQKSAEKQTLAIEKMIEEKVIQEVQIINTNNNNNKK
jgi:hypothetical protein